MNIIIFVVILAIIFVMFIAAEYLDVVLHIAAFALLFILGVTILTTNLEYKTGENLTTSYTYLDDNITINQTSESRISHYETFNETYTRIIGILLAAASVFGFVLVYVHYGRKRDKDAYGWNDTP